MRRIPKQSGLFNYLERIGVLDSKNEAQIKEGKKEYWKQYDKARKQKSRTKQKREIAIAFPEDTINHIRFTAKTKGYTTVQNYIRACVEADMSQLAVIPHRALVAEIKQILQQCSNQLEAIKQKEGKSWLIISRTNENIESVLHQTESRITQLLSQPKSLREIILDTISRNPNTIHLLKSILADHGSDKINDEKNGIV